MAELVVFDTPVSIRFNLTGSDGHVRAIEGSVRDVFRNNLNYNCQNKLKKVHKMSSNVTGTVKIVDFQV